MISSKLNINLYLVLYYKTCIRNKIRIEKKKARVFK